MLSEIYIESGTGSGQPGIRLNPRVLLCGLQSIHKFLMKQAEMIVQADSLSGKSQRAMESMKQAASRPRPPFPREGSGSASSILAISFPCAFRMTNPPCHRFPD